MGSKLGVSIVSSRDRGPKLFLFSRDSLFNLMCMAALPAGMYVHHVHAWRPQRSEERSYILEPELQSIVSHHAGAGD